MPVGAVDEVKVSWSDWIDELPAGQTLDTVVPTFDGSDGGLAVQHQTIVGSELTLWIDATGASNGIYRLVLTGTSTAALPIPDYVLPRVLTIQVAERLYVEVSE